ncbi:outer membrane protein [Niveispirillum irakense]|uniref:outer membrane protein n=1 Tax=Niveispirillum irakense TaxID=34011 RepID=UPI0004085249|nr:outer membrane beta-barrel protein [Niveispirillum irakense]
MSRFAYALLAGVALVGAAAAPSLAQSTAFNGPYVGLYTGYNFSDAETKTTGLSQDLNQDGWSYGGYLGYGQTFDRIYVGAEGEIGGNDLKGSKTLAGRVTSLDANETYGLSVRAGYLVTDNALVYGRVGWQRTNYEINSGSLSRHTDLDGVRFGGGVEVAMTENVVARLEYNYTDYDKLNYNVGTANYSVQPDGGQLRLGVGYRF